MLSDWLAVLCCPSQPLSLALLSVLYVFVFLYCMGFDHVGSLQKTVNGSLHVCTRADIPTISFDLSLTSVHLLGLSQYSFNIGLLARSSTNFSFLATHLFD